jgi:hypothetical protein
MDDERPPAGWPPPATPDSAPAQGPIVAWSAPPTEAGAAWQYEHPAGWAGLDVGRLFGATIETFLAHWLTFVALSIPTALVVLLSIVSPVNVNLNPSGGRQQGNVLGLLFAPVGIYVTTAIAMATDDARAGRRVSALAVLGPALGRAIVGLISAIAVFICIVGLAIIPTLVIGVIGAARNSSAAAVLVAVILFLVFLGALLYVLFRWSLGPIAIAIDRAGPVGALNRSWRITRGNLWRLGVLVIGIALLGGPWSAAGSLFLLGDRLAAGALVSVVGVLVFGALGTIVVTLAYGEITGRWREAAAEAGNEVAAAEAESPVTSVDAVPPPEAVAPDLASPPGTLATETAAAPAPRAPPSVSRPVRRAYVLGVLVIGLVLLVPAVAAAVPTFGNLGFAGVPVADRGVILAGTQRNLADPCSPLGRGTTFSTTDTIYIGGYFTRVIPPGQSATVRVFVDDAQRAAVPIPASTQMVGCYYEEDGLVGLAPGEYRLVVDDPGGVLAEGTFTVR